jgi:transcription elongation GreA/GreB family factor
VAQGALYVTERGLSLLQSQFEFVKSQLKATQGETAEAFQDGGGTWHDNPAVEDVNRRTTMLSTRVAEISDQMSRISIVPDRPIQNALVGIGHTITLENLEGQTFRYEVGGFGESDPKANPPRVDYTAPLLSPFFRQSVGHEAGVKIGPRRLALTLVKIE